MRTTVDIEESLIRKLKRMAADANESMSQTINRLVLLALDQVDRSDTEHAEIVWHVAEGSRPAPGFDPSSRDYLDLLDEGDGAE